MFILTLFIFNNNDGLIPEIADLDTLAVYESFLSFLFRLCFTLLKREEFYFCDCSI